MNHNNNSLPFTVYRECPVIYSGPTRRYGECSPYANICGLCGGYQRYNHHLPVVTHVAYNFYDPTSQHQDHMIVTPNNVSTIPPQRELTRTNLTYCQKEMMRDYADMLQWRIKGLNEEELSQFCLEIGVTSKVFKTWLRNNKNKFFHGVMNTNNAQSFQYRRGGGGDGGGSGSGIIGSG